MLSKTLGAIEGKKIKDKHEDTQCDKEEGIYMGNWRQNKQKIREKSERIKWNYRRGAILSRKNRRKVNITE